MRSDFNEFSYGYALVSDICKARGLRVAPIFPSLIEEGKKGGGYDVKMNYPGVPLYLQFKLSDYLKSRGAAQYSLFGEPYYRFPITARTRSLQHDMLVEMDRGNARVYYAAPAFHTNDKLNDFWSGSIVTKHSIFVAPRAINKFADDKPHSICFNEGTLVASKCWRCSTPKKIPTDSFDAILDGISDRLTNARSSLSDQIPKWLLDVHHAKTKAELGYFERGGPPVMVRKRAPDHIQSSRQDVTTDGFDSDRLKKENTRLLQNLAMKAHSVLGAQLFVVQANKCSRIT